MASQSVLCILLLLVAVGVSATGGPFNDLRAFGYNPVANKAAVVVSGSARFTVLSDYVIRMEYAHTGQFEDRATIAIVNRAVPVPAFTQKTENSVLTIETKALRLSYQTGQAFAAYSLSVTLKEFNNAVYKYGDYDGQNLFGTIKSLDELCTISLNCSQNANVIIHDESLHCAWGVVSRGGWTTIQETGNYILSAKSTEWFANNLRNIDDEDIYFFGHGMNFRKALYDYTQLSGKIPLQQKAILGSWWTRWYDFDNSDLERLLSIFKSESVPLDVLILDMNWHMKNGWTGFSWDRQLFPYPSDTVNMIHSNGLLTAGNLHDADGVGSWEEKYKDMCKAMGQNPNANQPVTFQPLNATYMHSLEDIVLQPATGFDFFWIDWQQGGQAGGCSGGRMNPTMITDHVRGTDAIRRGENKRDAILARWGGLGGQRYPVGFSGDVSQLSWKCMAFQPYFSVTAANVAYGHISHDLVGPPSDHELHVRWMQFGAYSGVMRIHDRGMSAGSCYPAGNCAIVNVWKLPYHYFSAIRNVMQARVALLPYMYTETRKAYDTGIAMVHPMYYDWPTENGAYMMGPDGVHAQYMFGDDMLVAPICFAGDSTTFMAQKEIWLPAETWYDDVFGLLVRGGAATITQSYSMEEVPIFVRAGAIIPKLPNPATMGIANQLWDEIDLHVYPGKSSHSYSLYEDDGKTLNYLHSSGYSWTNISYSKGTSGQSMQFQIDANGHAATLVSHRTWRVFILNAMPIASATINGSPIPYHRQCEHTSTKGQLCFSYSGKLGAAILKLPSCSLSEAQTLSIQFAAAENSASLDRLKLFASRTQLAKRTMDDVRETPYSTTAGPGKFKQAGAHAVELSYLGNPANISTFLSNVGATYTQLMEDALAELGGNQPTPPPAPEMTSLVQLWSSSRNDMLLCGSKRCLETNPNYQTMWTEGYQAPAQDSNAVKLNDYYSTQYQDNYATTESATPTNYEPAVFPDGYVSSTNSTTGMACLQVWVNPGTNDHMTTACPQGVQWAQKNSYSLIHSCIGYITLESHQHHHPLKEMAPLKHSSKNVKIPKKGSKQRKTLRDQATSEAIALLSTALPI